MRGVVFLVLRPFCNAFAICATILPYLAHWYDDPENFPFRNSRKGVSPVRPFSLRLYAPRVRKNDFPSKGWRLIRGKGCHPGRPRFRVDQGLLRISVYRYGRKVGE